MARGKDTKNHSNRRVGPEIMRSMLEVPGIRRSMMSADYHDVPLTATATHEPYSAESDVQRAENPFAWALRFGYVPEGTKRGF